MYPSMKQCRDKVVIAHFAWEQLVKAYLAYLEQEHALTEHDENVTFSEEGLTVGQQVTKVNSLRTVYVNAKLVEHNVMQLLKIRPEALDGIDEANIKDLLVDEIPR